ncbi:hypothetical protein PENSPDRAFT_647137 [Peniophora sp. CONT]|nr:hypothetical protein PENSPDRAFT_647137 [Peniophora sp. CONT]
MEGQFSNVVPILQFLQRYLKIEGDLPELPDLEFSEKSITNEDTWAAEVNATGLCPNFMFCDTHSAGSESNGLQRRPDITAFALGESTDVLWDLVTKVQLEKSQSAFFRELFGRAALIIERKLASQDAFVDKDGIFTVEKPTQTSEIVRGQLIDYNVHHFSQQPRVSSIQLLLIHKYARLIWWDRAGAVVSEAFEWTKGTVFAEFLYRFNLLSRKQRGIDTSVRMASDEEARKARNACQMEDLPDLEAPFWVYPVPDAAVATDAPTSTTDAPATATDEPAAIPTTTPNPPASLTGVDAATAAAGAINDTVVKRPLWDFVVGRPVAPSRSFTGRNSTGFVAYDIKANAVAYLKDAWCPDDPDLIPEGDIYRKLQPKAGEPACPYIPTLVCAGEVRDEDGELQETISQDALSDAERARLRIRKHRHTRTVVREVGVPMTAFVTVPDLLELLSNTVDALEYAYKRKILHRDVSAGNIMIQRSVNTATVQALLVDWDLALDMDRVPSGDDRSYITGTWQFMSVPLLKRFQGHTHCIEDDLESIFWLLCYCLARYTDLHQVDDEAVMAFVHYYFDESLERQYKDAGHRLGGTSKSDLLHDLAGSGSQALLLSDQTHEALRILLKMLAKRFEGLHPIQVQKGIVAARQKSLLSTKKAVNALREAQDELANLERKLTDTEKVTFSSVKAALTKGRDDVQVPDEEGSAGSNRTHDRYKKGVSVKAQREQKEAEKRAEEEKKVVRAGLGPIAASGSAGGSRKRLAGSETLAGGELVKSQKSDRSSSAHQNARPSQHSARMPVHPEEP